MVAPGSVMIASAVTVNEHTKAGKYKRSATAHKHYNRMHQIGISNTTACPIVPWLVATGRNVASGLWMLDWRLQIWTYLD